MVPPIPERSGISPDGVPSGAPDGVPGGAFVHTVYRLFTHPNQYVPPRRSSGMALHAVDAVSDAFGVTREFLLPFEPRRWAKLAVVVLFVGGGLSLPSVQSNASGGIDESVGTDLPSLAPDAMAVVGAVVAVIVLVGIAYSVVGAVMEFVLVESLRTGDVSIRRHWRRRWRQGLRLFGFRIAIGLPVLALVVGWIGLLIAPGIGGGGPIVPAATLFFVGLPVVFLVGLLYALVASFTTVFVVPIMIETDSGVLAAWRRLWGSVRAHPKQYLAYVVIGFVLTVAAGLLASVTVGIAGITLLIPFVLIGAVVYLTVSLSSAAGLVVLGGIGALFVVGLVVLWLFVRVPVVTYLRYYALLVLGDVDDSLDLVPDRRAAVRE